MSDEKQVVPVGSSIPGQDCNSVLANRPDVKQVVVVKQDDDDDEDQE